MSEKAPPEQRRTSPDNEDRRSSRVPKERPERGPDPDTLEGPGARHEEKGEADARNKTTRRGER